MSELTPPEGNTATLASRWSTVEGGFHPRKYTMTTSTDSPTDA